MRGHGEVIERSGFLPFLGPADPLVLIRVWLSGALSLANAIPQRLSRARSFIPLEGSRARR